MERESNTPGRRVLTRSRRTSLRECICLELWLTAIASVCSDATALAQTELQPGAQTIAPGPYELHTAGQYVLTVQQPPNIFGGGAAPNLPGVIIGSKYDLGGEGVGFHEPVIGGGNAASYRSDGGNNLKRNTDNTANTAVVGWIATGTWLNYTVNVQNPGTYTAALRSESNTGGVVGLSVDGVTVSSATIGNTGPWDSASSWVILPFPGQFSLSAGQHVLRATSTAQWFDVNTLTITAANTTALPQTEFQPGTQTIPPGTYGLHTAGQYTVTVLAPDRQPSTPPAAPYPTPFPGNTVVNVAPGNGTLAAAFNAHGANTTYMLSAGTYGVSNYNNTPPFVVQANNQVFGVNPDMNTDRTIIQMQGSWSGGWGIFDSTNGGNGQDFQLWGVTIDMGGSSNGAGAEPRGTQLYSNSEPSGIHIQNCHFINICSATQGQECFILLNDNSNTVDTCRFSYATSGNVDGHTTVAGGTVSNCVFDTPTDSNIAYFHCIGDPCTVINCTFTAPPSSVGAFGEFIYGEPGNGVPQGTPKSTASGCTVNLNNNPAAAFASIYCHTNMTTNWWGGIDVTNNTISNGTIFHAYVQGGLAGPAPEVTEVTIEHNTLTNCIPTSLPGGVNFGIGSLTASPNP